ncbi:BLUF domain-containing protein [Okeanomitos corallinicola TIOX110]|uniref:BLUF domain-containing protein n=1 Tax=Okeanomitos corallinicola TIOX110 TaxID=3133117 RepID=A0ABZ2UUF9_9CYAN
MNLYRIIYSSYGKPDLGYHDLRDIMQKSEINNQRDGITGMLCYGDFVFLQILEGDRTTISNTFNRISQDPRHHTPELIECRPIKSRIFGVWSMKTVNLSDLKSEQVKNLILKYSTSDTMKPHNMSPKQCLSLMQELAVFYDK